MEPQHKSAPKDRSSMWFGVIATVVVIGFFAGMFFLKSQNSSTQNSSDTTQSTGLSNGPSMISGDDDTGGACTNGNHKAVMMVSGEQIATCGTPVNGKITNVGSDSVTITDNETGSSKTYKITSDSVIAKQGGVKISLSDLTVGENIGVIPSDDDSAVLRILADLPADSTPTAQN